MNPKENPALNKLKQLADQAKQRGFRIEKKEVAQESISRQEAKEIMGDNNFYGPEDIYETFGIEEVEVPPILFSKKELEYARELGQELVLYIDKLPDGTPFDIHKMHEIINKKKPGSLLITTESDVKNFYLPQKEVSRFGWRLSDKEKISGSNDKDFIDQTQWIIFEIMDRYREDELPLEYQQAFAEFKEKKIDSLEGFWAPMTSDARIDAGKAFIGLKVNQLFRETAVEMVYRMVLHQTKKQEYLMSSHILTNSSLGFGEMIGVRYSKDQIIHLTHHTKYDRDTWVCLSRGV